MLLGDAIQMFLKGMGAMRRRRRREWLSGKRIQMNPTQPTLTEPSRTKPNQTETRINYFVLEIKRL